MLTAPARLLLLIVTCVALLARVALADEPKALKGMALVIGQSKYEHLAALPNPANDARAMEDLLARLGFTVEGVQDRKARRLRGDIEDFVEDAEGADVALVYYSGHGIEAVGENYLLPVDADAEGLEEGGEDLVAVSTIIEELRARARVVIVLLDACRTNPFPPTATFRTSAGGQVALAVQGLGSPRGFVAVQEGPADAESLGAVIGFAAGPGQAALDGEPGRNSPYAAALLKHVSAPGAEFGDVMTMVAEEVYLQTRGQQQPWANASLRRLLYFGQPAEDTAGDEAMLKAGRRQLLLTINTLPKDLRRTVEQLANDGGLPLAPLYGMLKQLQVDTSAGPQDIEKHLRAGAENLKKLLASRDTIERTDPEIIRLTGLGDRAQAEGAIALAMDYRAQASTRARDVSKSLKSTEDQLAARHREVAATFAKEAETALLAFDHPKAAEKYAAALAEVERWDRDLAWEYIRLQGNAWSSKGDFSGNAEAYSRATEVFAYGIASYPRSSDPERWAKLKNNMAGILVSLSEMEGTTDRLLQAVSDYREVLQVLTIEKDPVAWATAQNNLGNALRVIGEAEAGNERLLEAIATLRAALAALDPAEQTFLWTGTISNLGTTLTEVGRRQHDAAITREAVDVLRKAAALLPLEKEPYVWLMTRINLGNALAQLGDQLGDAAYYEDSVRVLKAALGEVKREQYPLNWAGIHNNMATVLAVLAESRNDAALLEQAIASNRAALEIWTREKLPRNWAIAQANLGDALRIAGLREAGTASLLDAIAAYRLSSEERTRERDPIDWARTQHFLGVTLHITGEREGNVARFAEAETAYRAALTVRSRDRFPLEWAMTADALARLKFAAGTQETATRQLEEALALFEQVEQVWTRSFAPYDWGGLQNKRGRVFYELGLRESGPGRFRLAIDSYRLAQQQWSRAKAPLDWAVVQNNIGLALHMLGEREGNGKRLEEAVEAFRAAAAVWTKAQRPLDWATLQDNIGWTLGQLGEGTGNAAMVEEGRLAVQSAWDAVRSTGEHGYDNYFSNRIAVFDRTLAQLR